MSPRVALVTGASRGIGAAIAARLSAAGWKVAACAREERSLKVGDHRFACDVTDPEQVRDAVAGTLAKLGRIDALVCNAGLAGSNSMSADENDDLWHRIVDVNLNGTYYFAKQALPHLPDGTGRIVTIGSTLSLRGVPDQPAYCAAKHAVLGLTRSLAHFAAARRITVNCVCPGWTRTEMAEGRRQELGWTQAELESGVPLGRMIEPDEVARLVEYLLSEAAAGVTGRDFVIDGGALA